jgi:hypothetical protein
VLALGLALLSVSLSGDQNRVRTTSEAVVAAVSAAQIIAFVASPFTPGAMPIGARKIHMSR